MTHKVRVAGKPFGRSRPFQSRIKATTQEQGWHYPFPESLMAPTGFALEGFDMRKGFTRQPPADEPATRSKNYITPSGLQRLKEEHRFLLTRERPAVTKVVACAASNGDRGENADSQYGKRALRQLAGRSRSL